jgi:hypothetical protein
MASLSNSIPPVFSYLTNLVSFGVWILSPGGSYPQAYTIVTHPTMLLSVGGQQQRPEMALALVSDSPSYLHIIHVLSHQCGCVILTRQLEYSPSPLLSDSNFAILLCRSETLVTAVCAVCTNNDCVTPEKMVPTLVA